MLDTYTCLTFLSVGVCIVMLIMVRGNAMLSGREKRLYNSLYVALAIASVCDWLGTLIDGMPDERALMMVLCALEFALAPSLAVNFGATTSSEDDETVAIAYKALNVHALMQFVFMPFGLIFYVDAGGFYHRGPLYPIYIVAYLMSGVFLLVETLRFSREYQYKQRYVLWILLGLAAAALVAQSFVEGGIIWLALAVCSSLFYVFYCNVIQQTDGLTCLLNRQSYEGCITRLNERAAVVYFDVDNFKQVNDTFGHAMGDKCLREVAAAVISVYASRGGCYRIGGDEFCAVLTRDVDDLNRLRSDFFAELTRRRAALPELPSVSLGYSIFNPEINDKSDVIRHADMMMYRFKRARKANAGQQ